MGTYSGRQEAVDKAFEHFDASSIAGLLGFNIWYSLYKSDYQKRLMNDELSADQQEVLTRFCTYVNNNKLQSISHFDLSYSCDLLSGMLAKLEENDQSGVKNKLSPKLFDLKTFANSISALCAEYDMQPLTEMFGELEYYELEETVENGRSICANLNPGMYFRLGAETLNNLAELYGKANFVPRKFKHATAITVESWSDRELFRNFQLLAVSAGSLGQAIKKQENSLSPKISFIRTSKVYVALNALKAVDNLFEMFYGEHEEPVTEMEYETTVKKEKPVVPRKGSVLDLQKFREIKDPSPS
jgi:hypothetical protein